MIPLLHPCRAEGSDRFVTRLCFDPNHAIDTHDSVLVSWSEDTAVFSGERGLVEISGLGEDTIDGDVIAVDPARNSAERLVRYNSRHNTFLITERCDQLCVMCSQPPKKTHIDRFAEFTQAALLAPIGETIGLSGGEPTLFKEQLFSMIETVRAKRPDISFHILSNAQHFDDADISRLSSPLFEAVTWGVPLYSHVGDRHDIIVAKGGAFEQLMRNFAVLLRSGSQVELRTVVLSNNLNDFPAISRFVATHLGFCIQWSIMQLENIGFAKNRFTNLYVDHEQQFAPIAEAIDVAVLYGIPVSLFNFARCSVPKNYREYAVASISDWKRKFPMACNTCTEQALCSGFFEWHPETMAKVTPL